MNNGMSKSGWAVMRDEITRVTMNGRDLTPQEEKGVVATPKNNGHSAVAYVRHASDGYLCKTKSIKCFLLG
ncbi:9777_t:CDS:2 [Funneliformis mosseae]|uniref:9777_t:CDS:1 n=1 Tax=Funneliformis mosseae TaxID=27381 RepID=A0A9N9C4T4_FUNMO|nr:9777_t:CDS:2 [Funneliformis mosseae]